MILDWLKTSNFVDKHVTTVVSKLVYFFCIVLIFPELLVPVLSIFYVDQSYHMPFKTFHLM